MNDLIEACRIFAGSKDIRFPFWCEHDCLHVVYDPSNFSDEEIKKLYDLGFVAGDGEFYSFRYGSC